MSRGSAISRVRQYFREAPLDEVEVALTLVQKDVGERKRVTSKPAAGPTRRRTRTRPTAPATAAPAQIAEQEIA